jgi:ABC-type branched-subunit amino acid transport system substrate-binding protein
MATKKDRVSIIIGITLALALLLVPATGASAASKAKTLKIGALFSVTGFFSVREVPDYNQAKIAADMINEQGGITIKGQKYMIELVLEDCKTAMDGVTAAANKLIYGEKLHFFIGPTAFFAAAASPVCDPNQGFRMITWCVNTPGEVDAGTPYAFLGGSGSVLNGTAAAKHLKKAYPHVQKVAVVIPDDGSIPYFEPILRKILKEEGFSIVGDIVAYSNTMQDMSPIVAKLHAIKDADAIFMQNGLVPHMGLIVKGLRELGDNRPYAGALPARISQIMNIAGPEKLKDVFTVAFTPGDPQMAPIAKEVVARTLAQYGKGYQLELSGPNCLWILKEVIEAAQSLDPAEVKKTFEGMDEVETIFGKARISGDKTFGIKHHVVASPQPIQILQDGKEACPGWIDLGVIP